MVFNTVTNGVLTPYEFEIYYDDFATPHLAKTPFLVFLGLNPERHLKGVGAQLPLTVGGRKANCLTLVETSQFLDAFRVRSDMKNPELFKSVKEHFLPFINHALAPVAVEVSVVDIWEAAPRMGEGAWRADAVLQGKTPSQINYEILTGYEEIVTSRMTRVVPGFSAKGAEPKLIQTLGKRSIILSEHVRGKHLPDSIEPLRLFELRNPGHALVNRRDNFEPEYITTGKEGSWGRELNPNRTEVKPWDNEFSLIGVSK